MRPPAILIAVAGLLLALAGCSQPAPPVPFSVPTSPAPQPTKLSPEQEALFGPRVDLPGGLLLKQLGKVAQWGGPNDDDPNTWAGRLILDKIEVDPKCDPYKPKPERGHRLLLTMRVETSADYEMGRDSMPGYFEWSTIGQDGVSEAAMSTYIPCRNATDLPVDLRPSAKYRATVSVDTSNARGRLVFMNFAAWDYPTA